MPLGWIDFSKSDQAKALDVLSNLKESGTLDELGIAPIRDWFSWYFFPGTSTIQTRAKYFLIVPYALIDLEKGGETDRHEVEKLLDATERTCAQKLYKDVGTGFGVIGQDQRNWVKRTPSNIYWAGLRQFGIFGRYDPNLSRMSLQEYIQHSCAQKKRKQEIRSQRKTEDSNEYPGVDDSDAGSVPTSVYWDPKLPYTSTWENDLHMKLTKREALFLQNQIANSHNEHVSNSMLAYFLKDGREEERKALKVAEKFEELHSMAGRFPDEMRENYQMAMQFSRFYNIVAAVYNIVVSEGNLKKAVDIWNSRPEEDLKRWREERLLERIFAKMGKDRNGSMEDFLRKAMELMCDCDGDGNLEKLKDTVIRREVDLKGAARAKTVNPKQYNLDGKYKWYGIENLDYRFPVAKELIKDIIGGLENAGT